MVEVDPSGNKVTLIEQVDGQMAQEHRLSGAGIADVM
jgi:hypothetical protein